MFLINRNKCESTLHLFSGQKVTLESGKGIRIDSDSADEVVYYKAFHMAGLIVVPDELYGEIKGAISKPIAVIEAPVEEVKAPVVEVPVVEVPVVEVPVVELEAIVEPDVEAPVEEELTTEEAPKTEPKRQFKSRK